MTRWGAMPRHGGRNTLMQLLCLETAMEPTIRNSCRNAGPRTEKVKVIEGAGEHVPQADIVPAAGQYPLARREAGRAVTANMRGNLKKPNPEKFCGE